MTSRADKVDRFPNKININAVKIQNLVRFSLIERTFSVIFNEFFVFFVLQKSPRAEPLTIFLRFEYNEGLFGESAKFDFTDGSPRQIDHIAILSTNATDPVQMDDLGQKPVLSMFFYISKCFRVIQCEICLLLSYTVRSGSKRQKSQRG